MNVGELSGAERFLEVVAPFLVREEAVHCILLGIPGDLVRFGGGEEARFWVVRDEGGEVVGAAMLTPPMSMSASRMSDPAVVALARGLAQGRVELPGVVGPAEVSDHFAEEWTRLTGSKSEVVAAGQHLWELTAVNAVPDARGTMEIGEERDLAALTPWSPVAAEEFANTVEQWEAQTRRACERGRLFVWRDREPAAMAMLGGQTPNGIRVSGVFTPPEKRRHGYATSLVAAMSRYVIANGRSRCFLFTDAQNATAEGVYARIGYQQLARIRHHRFG